MSQDEFNEVTEMDLIYETNDRLDALIELLVEKKVFTEGEYNRKLQSLLDNLEENQ